MKAITRIEQSLAMALAAAEDASCPPKLASAVRHAVFPGGARIRPQLCLAVAQACGQDDQAHAGLDEWFNVRCVPAMESEGIARTNVFFFFKQKTAYEIKKIVLEPFFFGEISEDTSSLS